jgi:antitoxin (DNA-binding transcriptional repressor) of toxin-antitoxin stability system
MKQAAHKLETVGIKLLRDGLSSYLRKVELGVKVLISDHGRIIAQLSSPSEDRGKQERQHPKIEEWIQNGLLNPGQENRTIIPQPERLWPDGVGITLLDAERGAD